ncbi:hypothetical protein ACFYNO_39555 [Kitasatospora sp. NPDC006697]|uniref:hypothetical protein n=1 Tax=Kitasatospora sp. NPDC006697 TaxID=3364020 RepID=UPI0036B9109B
MSETLNRFGYLDGPRDNDAARAAEWQRDERMEKLAAMRDSNPEAYDRMGTTVRMSLGYYENAKKIAAQYGRDTTKGGN